MRTADLRYFGQAYEVRVPAGPGPVDEASPPPWPTRFHDAHRQLYGYDFRDDPRQQVEWVNLRVTGVGPITRPELREIASRGAPSTARTTAHERARRGHPRASASTRMPGYVATDVYWRPDLRAGDTFSRPGDHRGVRLDRPGPPRLHRARRRVRQPRRHRRGGRQ